MYCWCFQKYEVSLFYVQCELSNLFSPSWCVLDAVMFLPILIPSLRMISFLIQTLLRLTPNRPQPKSCHLVPNLHLSLKIN